MSSPDTKLSTAARTVDLGAPAEARDAHESVMNAPVMNRPLARAAMRLAFVCAVSGALAGCFQPLYAENSTVGGPALKEQLADVEIIEIKGRLGNELRNDLIFALSGGAGNPKGAPYQMIISADSSIATALVNSGSGLPENQIVRVNAKWRMVRADDPKKATVVSGSAFGSATIDVSDQRYANYAAQRDAENRAARTAVDQIKAQLAAYFIRAKGTALPGVPAPSPKGS